MVHIIDLNSKEINKSNFSCKQYKERYYVSIDKDNFMFQVKTNSLNWSQPTSIKNSVTTPNKYYNAFKGDLRIEENALNNITDIDNKMKGIIDTSGLKLGKKNEYKSLYKTYSTKNGEASSMEISVMAVYENDLPNSEKITTVVKLSYKTKVERLEITIDNISKYINTSIIPSEIMKIIETNYNGCYKWKENYYDFEDYKSFMNAEQIKLLEKLVSDKGEVFVKYNTLTTIKELIRYNTQVVVILKPGSVYVESQYGIALKLFKVLILNESPVRNSTRVDFINIQNKTIKSDDEASSKMITNENSDSEDIKSIKTKSKHIAQIDSDDDEPKPKPLPKSNVKQVEVDSEDSDEPKPQVKSKPKSKAVDSDEEPKLKLKAKPKSKAVEIESDGSDSEPEPIKVTKVKSKK
jgi:hypothetical protein